MGVRLGEVETTRLRQLNQYRKAETDLYQDDWADEEYERIYRERCGLGIDSHLESQYEEDI